MRRTSKREKMLKIDVKIGLAEGALRILEGKMASILRKREILMPVQENEDKK